MSTKLKVLGMGLLVVMATSAFAVANAGAEGHFTSDVEHTQIKGFESGTHTTHFRLNSSAGATEYIGCEEDGYEGTTTAQTTISITISISLLKCRTTNEAKTAVTIDTNGCGITLTITLIPPRVRIDLHCPFGKFIQITHPNCTTSIHPQSVEAGTYTTDVESGKHILTVDVAAAFNATYHGLCQFVIPTNSTFEWIGSTTLKGFNTEGNLVNITAT